jgi:Histidine kinase-like ATPase domain
VYPAARIRSAAAHTSGGSFTHICSVTAAYEAKRCWATPWRRVFPGEERQLAVLRRWLESLLPDCPERDDVVCVASELGTNAVRHTATGRGGWFVVEIICQQSAVRVAVTDCGAPGEPHMIDDPAGEHGRGLLVVQGLSVRTGVCGDHRGRLVWADVRWDTAQAAAAGWKPVISRELHLVTAGSELDPGSPA